MGILIFYKCSACKTKLGTQDAYDAIGTPYLICPSCGAVNIISKNRNEWDLKTFSQRLEMYLGIVITPIAVGVGGSILVYLTIVYAGNLLFQFQIPKLIDIHVVGLMSMVSVPASFLYFSRKFRKNIAESQQRMRNSEYLQRLKELGLVKQNNKI